MSYNGYLPSYKNSNCFDVDMKILLIIQIINIKVRKYLNYILKIIYIYIYIYTRNQISKEEASWILS